MKKIVKYTFDEWKELYEGKYHINCAIHFMDGFFCSAVSEKYINIIHDVDFYKKEHGEVSHVSMVKNE